MRLCLAGPGDRCVAASAQRDTRSSVSDSHGALVPGEGPGSQTIGCQGSDYHGRVNKTAHSQEQSVPKANQNKVPALPHRQAFYHPPPPGGHGGQVGLRAGFFQI